MVGNLLRLCLCTAENDSIDARVVIHNTLECEILVLGIYKIVDVVYVLSALIS